MGAQLKSVDTPVLDLSGTMAGVLERQRAAFEQDRYPSLQERKKNLKRLEGLLHKNRDRIVAALAEDFGHRSTEETRIAEISATVAHIEYSLKHLASWMRPQRRATAKWFLPGKNRIQAQPRGVVGIMVPWNYPINLALVPLISAFAAGNRGMIKMSEFTPASERALRDILAQGFSEDQVAVFGGDASASAEFSGLPFDHLLFTGSSNVGRKIMAAAAPNLTPVTLELGGKSPVIVSDDFPIEEAAKRILWGKSFNAGQTCVAPDYVLVPKGKADDFVVQMSRQYRQFFPDGAASDDYTSVIDQRNFDRLASLVSLAEESGSDVVPMEECSEELAAKRKFPLTLVVGPSPDSRIMQEEVFGPVLPVVEVDGLDSAMAMVNESERPLALYYFGHNEKDQDRVLKGTHAGGVTVNDVMLQFLQVSQPFGGVGESGIGSYHGKEGFNTFSHLKPVFNQRGIGRFTALKLLYPPYGPRTRHLIDMMGG